MVTYDLESLIKFLHDSRVWETDTLYDADITENVVDFPVSDDTLALVSAIVEPSPE